MSQLDEIIQIIIDEKCPLDLIIEKLHLIEINDQNIEKIQQIENLIEIHEETSRRLRHTLRLRTSNYYKKSYSKNHQIT